MYQTRSLIGYVNLGHYLLYSSPREAAVFSFEFLTVLSDDKIALVAIADQ